MISNRLAVVPSLTAQSFCPRAIELKLAWNHRLSEIPFADEIRHDIDFTYRFRLEQEHRIAQTWFLLPECAFHLRESLSTPNRRRVRQRRRAGIGIDCRAVRDDQQCC